MNLKPYLDVLFGDCQNPCCLSDVKSDDIVYMNVAMKKMFEIVEEIPSQKCYEILQEGDARCSFCPNDSLEFLKIHETYIYNQKLDEYFRVNHTLLQYEGIDYNLCKYYPAPTFSQQQQSFDDAMSNCLKIFKMEEDAQVPAFLEILGKFYGSEKAYIYDFDQEDGTIQCEEMWVKASSIIHFKEISDKIPMKGALEWFGRKNEIGIIEANSVLKDFTEDSIEAYVLKAFQLENVVLCNLADNSDKLERMVGLSNRKETEFDYRFLRAVARFLFRVGNKQSQLKAFEEVMNYDFLTGCYSRNLYSKDVDAMIKTHPKSLAVVFINVNGMDRTHETIGLAKSDSKIRRMAHELKNYFGQQFYRTAGNNFLTFYKDIEESEFTKKMLTFNNLVRDSETRAISVGYAWKKGKFDVQELVEESRIIMYINKQRYYNFIRHLAIPSSSKLLNDLLSYLNNDEFLVYLQPQVDLLSDELVGAEALIRRFDKINEKMVFPDEFIPLYEHESIIRHIDLFVVEKVCHLLSEWEKTHKPVPISVNLSRVTLLEYGIVDTIADICDKYKVDHSLVIIEVTERVGMIENDVASSLIVDFMAQGFKISLDDFGCAYSNIVTLSKIEVNEVKIDKSLVDDLLTSEKNQIIVGNILNMCNSFDNTHTLAEGIEDKVQAEILREFGCSYGQGYFYSRPIPENEFFERYIKGTQQK